MRLRSVVRIALTAALVAAVVVGVRMLLPPSVTESGAPPEPDRNIFDPRRQQVELPPTYRPSVGRDVIRPIYDPQFVPGAQADWPDDTLVLGVAIDGEAKAYPVNVLNFRETVIDRLRGIPLLVSW